MAGSEPSFNVGQAVWYLVLGPDSWVAEPEAISLATALVISSDQVRVCLLRLSSPAPFFLPASDVHASARDARGQADQRAFESIKRGNPLRHVADPAGQGSGPERTLWQKGGE